MDNFNVQVFSQPNKKSWLENLKGFLSFKRFILAVLVIILVLELISVIKALVTPIPPVSSPKQAEVVSQIGGRITLGSSKADFIVGEVIPVSVVVNAGSHEISGIDLVVQFDPKVLTVSKEVITKGEMVDEYPLISVDNKNGLVSISGIETLGNSFKGIGSFAQINFKAKLPGKTLVSINFVKDSTTASNLVEAATSKNILEAVDNLEIEIK